MMFAVTSGGATAAATESAAIADSAASRRVVLELPALEVHALLHDLRSGETIHEISEPVLSTYPVDGLAEVVALQAGVVAQGEELHVRGGRAGETGVILDGMTLNEPLRHRPLELPLLALRSVDLVSGAPESRHAGSLAGLMNLHTFDPGERAEGAWRWQSDGGLDTRYDRLSARASTPLPWLGLGIVAAGDATLDNTSLPMLRTPRRHRVSGVSLGWRAENRLLGYLKLAPAAAPRHFALQLLASHKVHEPYDPMWSIDGWSSHDDLGFVYFSPDSLPGYTRYRAADHQAITDERRLGALLTLAGVPGPRRASLGLGWLRTRTATTVGGGHRIPESPPGAEFDSNPSGDPFHVLFGDDPLYRVGGSDVVSLRGDAERQPRRDLSLGAGAGISIEHAWQQEFDATLIGQNLDSLRAYDAKAPGGFVYGQARWLSGGMVLNGGVRVAYFTAGSEGDHQTLPGREHGVVSFAPRLGIAYPISIHDAFSVSYARAQQDPERDLLYDRRTTITNRQPLGNPALPPAVLISYEATLKHLAGVAWVFQTSYFHRDLADVPGARDYRIPGGPIDLRYTDEDKASASGLELSVTYTGPQRRRFDAHYTFMHAQGFESRPEGDPYGPLRGPRTSPIAEQPLSWDRRHTFQISGAWGWTRRLSVQWSSIVGSGLPWTPKPRREELADVTLVNSRRFGWTETTSLNLAWSPPYALGLEFALEARNIFDSRGERSATVDGYPNPLVNTLFDDYGAYRTETGLAGGGYWSMEGGTSHWVPVHDPRLFNPPRALRASVGRSW